MRKIKCGRINRTPDKSMQKHRKTTDTLVDIPCVRAMPRYSSSRVRRLNEKKDRTVWFVLHSIVTLYRVYNARVAYSLLLCHN